MSVVIDKCKRVFEGLESLLVDVRGGIRTVAKTVADAFPNMKCTVFDLLQVVMDLQGSHVRYMPSPSKGVLAIRDQIVKKKRIASSSSKKDKYLNAISLKNKIVIATDISNEPF
nr:(+)-6a-hydroxymaackiain 3-o-methyltransferase 2 [Quercus suber]